MVPVRKTVYEVLLKIPFVVANIVKEKDSVSSFISFLMLSCEFLSDAELCETCIEQVSNQNSVRWADPA